METINLGGQTDVPVTSTAAPAPQPNLQFAQLMAALGNNPGKPVKQVVSKEDLKKQSELITSIGNALSHYRFKAHLAQVGFVYDLKALHKMSVDELQEMLDQIHHSINCKNNSGMFEKIALKVAGTAETLFAFPSLQQKTGIKLDGYTDLLSHNEAFLDTIAQLELTYGNMASMSPEIRILFIMAYGAIQIVAAHKVAEKYPQLIAAMAAAKLNDPDPPAPPKLNRQSNVPEDDEN